MYLLKKSQYNWTQAVQTPGVQGSNVVGLTQYVIFAAWLLKHYNVHLRLLYVFSWLDSSFFEHWIIFHCLEISQFIYPFTHWKTSLVIMNEATINIYVQAFVCRHLQTSFPLIGGIYQREHLLVWFYSVLEKKTTPPNWLQKWPILHSHWQWLRVLVAPCLRKHLVFSGVIWVFWVFIILLVV